MQGMMKKMKGGGLMKMMRAWAAGGFPGCRADIARPKPATDALQTPETPDTFFMPSCG
jgi:hypothetical protein